MYGFPSKYQNPRKRRQEPANPDSKSLEVLVTDTSSQNFATSNVVDGVKVKSYLFRLQSAEKEAEKTGEASIRIVLSISEVAEVLTKKRDDFTEYLNLCSVHITPTKPLSVDRVVTLHGKYNDVIRCTLYIAFLLNSSLNNSSKTQPFTLRSSNYHTSVLIEGSNKHITKAYMKQFTEKSIDLSQYERNLGLQLVTLSGDFSSLFKSLSFLLRAFPYNMYAPEDSVKFTPLQNNQAGVSSFTKPALSAGVDDHTTLGLLDFAYRNQ